MAYTDNKGAPMAFYKKIQRQANIGNQAKARDLTQRFRARVGGSGPPAGRSALLNAARKGMKPQTQTQRSPSGY